MRKRLITPTPESIRSCDEKVRLATIYEATTAKFSEAVKFLHFGQQNFIGSFHRVTPINFLHDPLCPSDSIRYGSHRRGNPCSAVVLRELTRCKD